MKTPLSVRVGFIGGFFQKASLLQFFHFQGQLIPAGERARICADLRNAGEHRANFAGCGTLLIQTIPA